MATKKKADTQKAKTRGRGIRLKKVSLKLPKSTYMIISGIAMGDERRINKLIQMFIEDGLEKYTVEQIQKRLYAKKREEEEEIKEEVTT